MNKRRREEGFTLIELMIVIAVIGILAVVLVPKMAGIKTSAKATGVETNVKSVQVYVVANMDKWINSGYTNANMATAIYANFSSDNALKNPFSGLTDIKSSVGGVQLDNSTAISSSLVSTDALQVLGSTPGTGYSNGHGTVVINVPATAVLLSTNGIEITGYDDAGNIVDGTVKVRP